MQSNLSIALFCCLKGVILIAIYQKIISRGKGKSAAAAAAYRSGEIEKPENGEVLDGNEKEK